MKTYVLRATSFKLVRKSQIVQSVMYNYIY